METLLSSLLEALPQPVVAAKEGKVCLWNSQAARCLPGLRQDLEIASLLPEAEGGEPVLCAACALGTVRVSCWQDFRLYTICPADAPEMAALEAAGVEMRQDLNMITLAYGKREIEAENAAQSLTGRLPALVHRSIYRLSRTVENLALLGSDSLCLQRCSFDLAGHFAQLLQSVQLCTRREIRLDAPDSLPCCGDRALLERLLLNLVSNALKFAPEGPVLIRLQKSGDRILLTVCDSGSGFDPDRLPEVFVGGHSHRLPSPQEGAGLGLAVVRRIAVAHGGTVVLEGTAGMGGRVVVSIPQPEPETKLCCTVEPYLSRSLNPVLVELSDVLGPEHYERLYGD